MDQQHDVEIHYMPTEGLTYFLPNVYTGDQLVRIEFADLSGIQDMVKCEYEPLRLRGLETV